MKNHKVLLTQVTTVLFLACLGSLPVSAQLGAGFVTIDPPQSVSPSLRALTTMARSWVRTLIAEVSAMDFFCAT